MISEKELAQLSHAGAPKVTGQIPGPKAKEIFEQSLQYETPTRVAGYYLPIVWEEAKGATVKDPDGNIFIDMTGGLGVNNIGHHHPKVVEAVKRQADILMHALDVVHPTRTALAMKMAEIMPGRLKNNCFTAFATSGSGAVELAVKFAKQIKRKPEILVFQGAYHGVYGHSNAMTASYHYREGYGPFVPGVTFFPYGYCYRCFIGAEYPKCGVACAHYFDYVVNGPYTGVYEPAICVGEPIQGEGGYIDPPPEFWPIIKKACEKAGILFASDEIQAGFGRTGKLWAIEHWGVEPDMIIWGKGVGGDQPVTGVTLGREYYDKLITGSVPATFPGNGLAMVTALTNIEILTDPEADLMGRATRVGEYIKGMLKDAQKDSKVIGDVRGKGFMLSVEVVKDRETKEPPEQGKCAGVMVKMIQRGVLNFVCGRNGNVFRFMPPLTITKEYFEKAIRIFLETLKEEEDNLTR